MKEVLEAKNGIHGKHDHEHAAELLQNRELELLPEVFGAQRRFEDRHCQTHRDCRDEEKHRQQRAVPERVKLIRHDEVDRAQRRLVQGGENHADR